MRTPAKLSLYGGALVLVFGSTVVLGNATGSPVGAIEASHAGGHPSAVASEASTPESEVAAEIKQPGGLMTSERGYTLNLAADVMEAGEGKMLEFQVTNADGSPLMSYKKAHDKDLHLIAVRRDASGFQHVHPSLDTNGNWSVPLDLTAGTWRIFADFVPAEGQATGENIILGTDLAVPGNYEPTSLPAPSTTSETNGYAIELDGEFVPGQESELKLSVTQDGRPVDDLEPYLGAFGHLVALRDGDLAYLHVHPAGTPGDGTTPSGPTVSFFTTAPSSGAYRLFFDFKHEGKVQTAEFTVDTGTDAASNPEPTRPNPEESGDQDESQPHH